MIWPSQPQWDRLEVSSPQDHGNFDTENSTIRNVVIAETGRLKDGRGFLDERGIRQFAELFPSKGTKSRLSHPNATSDGVTRYLGRQTNPRVQQVGDKFQLLADLRLDPSSRVAPEGDLGKYVWTRAWSDPDSFATSVVAKFDWYDGERQIDRAEMEDLWQKSPGRVRWVPRELHASDVVDTGNATAAFFSFENLAWDDAVRCGSEVLDRMFADQPREVVARRATAFLERYLDHRYGEDNSMTQPQFQLTEPTDHVPTATFQSVQGATAQQSSQPAAPPILAQPAAHTPRLPDAVPQPTSDPIAQPAVPPAPAQFTVQPAQPPHYPAPDPVLRSLPQPVYMLQPAPVPQQPAVTPPPGPSREQKIAMLCQAANAIDRYSFYCAATWMSVEDIATDLQRQMSQQNRLPQQGPPPVAQQQNPDGLDQYRAEWRENEQFFTSLGIGLTEESYLETRRVDANGGVDPDTFPNMQLINATPPPKAAV